MSVLQHRRGGFGGQAPAPTAAQQRMFQFGQGLSAGVDKPAETHRPRRHRAFDQCEHAVAAPAVVVLGDGEPLFAPGARPQPPVADPSQRLRVTVDASRSGRSAAWSRRQTKRAVSKITVIEAELTQKRSG
jgi:hypothetical protein